MFGANSLGAARQIQFSLKTQTVLAAFTFKERSPEAKPAHLRPLKEVGPTHRLGECYRTEQCRCSQPAQPNS